MTAAQPHRNISPAALVLTWLALFAGLASATAVSAEEFEIDIPRLPLPAALRELAKQTQVQYGKDGPLPDALSGPLNGRYTLATAFERLLTGTDLIAEKVNDRTYLLKAVLEDRRGIAARPEVAEHPVESSQPRQEWGGSNEVLVTGSRIEIDTAAPILVYSSEQLQALGVSTLSDVQKFLSQPFAGERSSRRGQYVDLRGLGVQFSVVLINGRRVAAGAVDGVETLDLSLIPISAVARIEVLNDSASAEYPDHGGGVVNIILKQNIPAPSIELQYGAADGGGAERRIAFAAGADIGRWSGALLMEYSHRNQLLGSARDLWSNQDFTRFGGQDYRVIASRPGNVSSTDGQPLPGLGHSFAAIPAQGNVVGVQDFVATEGQLNLESLNRYHSVQPEVERITVLASAELEREAVIPSAELILVRREITDQISPPILSAVVVPANNPFNPFGVPVRVDALLPEFGPRINVRTSTWLRPVFALRSDADAWNWQVALSGSMERGSIALHNDLDYAQLSEALASTDPNTALNLFQLGATNPALLDSLATRTAVTPYSSTGTLLTGSVTGPLQTMLGEASLLVGGEWERLTTSLLNQTSEFERHVATAFAQITAPLVKHKLHLTIAGRLEHVDGFGMAFSPTFRFLLTPSRRTSLQVSYAASSRSPFVADMMHPRTVARVPVRDPQRHGEIAVVDVVTGGNLDLDPIRTETLRATLTLDAGDLLFFANYWYVTAWDRPIALTIGELLDHRAQLEHRIGRYAPTPADSATGQPGRLQSLDVSTINGGLLATAGIDFSVSQSILTHLGRFDSELLVSYVDRYATSVVGAEAVADRVGIAHPSGTILPWRAITSLRWHGDCAGVIMVARLTPAYRDFTTRSTPRTIRSQMLLDVQTSIELHKLLPGTMEFQPTTLTLGVQNILNSEPPFAEVGGSWGFDTSQSDLRQRFIYLRLMHQFR